MDELPDLLKLEKRLGRIEQRLDREEGARRPPQFHPAWPLALGLSAVTLGYFGVGLPSHYYQALFSAALLLFLYHRGRLSRMPGRWTWPLMLTNFLVVCLIFKLLIGGGICRPFDWIKAPAIAKVQPAEEQSWYSAFVPDYTVQWQAVPQLSEWSVDITKIQTFLLLAALAGSLFRFEPFTSIAAFVLLLLSLPGYLRYNWDLVIPFILLGSVSLYMQTGPGGQRAGSR